MKKIVLFLALVLLTSVVSLSWADKLQIMDHRPAGVKAVMNTAVINTLLDSETTEGTTGTAVDLGLYVSRFTCSIVWGGTAPTSTVTDLLGSIDGTSYVSLVEGHSSTASPDMYHVVNKPVRYVKGKYTSKVGGDATTSVTIKCVAGGE